MPRPQFFASGPAPASVRRRAIVAVTAVTAVIAGFGLAAVAGLAIAKTFTVEVVNHAKVTNMASKVTKVEAVVANSRGVALYTLTHDTIAHPGCTKANKCFMFWFPATVKSKSTKLTKPAGVKGTLRTFHRNGFFQLTLNNHPLYTFLVDQKKKGVANGEGLPSFGGVWHVVKASSSSKTKTKPTTASTGTTTMPYCVYPPC